MPDMEALLAHLPDVQAGRGWIFGLIILGSFFGATAVMVALDRQGPAWTGLGQVGAIIIGFIWTGQFFWRRRAYRARWGDLAYQRAFKKHILVGLPVIFAAIAHTAYLPGQRLPLGWAAPLVLGLGLYLVATGLVLWGRAIFIFGFDNLAMLYVYFPDEGRLVESAIYGIIRHPVYAAVIRIGLEMTPVWWTGS